MKHIACLLAAVLAVAACDLRLVEPALEGRRVVLHAVDATLLAAELRRRLREQGAVPAEPGAGPADLVLRLRDEGFERHLVSVFPDSGKVAEYQLEYSVSLGIGPPGAEASPEQRIRVAQDFAYGNEPALAKRGEEERLREELLGRAALLVLLRAAPPE